MCVCVCACVCVCVYMLTYYIHIHMFFGLKNAGAVNWWLSDHSERSRSVYGKGERTVTPKSSVSSLPTRPQHYPIPPTPQTGNSFAEWLPDFMELCSPVRESKMVEEVGGETGINHPWGVHGVNEPPREYFSFLHFDYYYAFLSLS